MLLVEWHMWADGGPEVTASESPVDRLDSHMGTPRGAVFPGWQLGTFVRFFVNFEYCASANHRKFILRYKQLY